MKALMVGVDGSETSLKAVRLACEIARPAQAAVSLVYVLTPLEYPSELLAAAMNELEEGLKRAGRMVLEKALAVARDARVEAKTEILVGSAAESIADAASSQSVDIVVVGSRGRGGVARAVLGSVSSRLVNICKRPVLVVH